MLSGARLFHLRNIVYRLLLWVKIPYIRVQRCESTVLGVFFCRSFLIFFSTLRVVCLWLNIKNE